MLPNLSTPLYNNIVSHYNNKYRLWNMSQAWLKFGECIHAITSKQWTVDTINSSFMKKAVAIFTTSPWVLYGKMSSQCNHKTSPNNVTNSFRLFCFPFHLNLERIKSSLYFLPQPSNRYFFLLNKKFSGYKVIWNPESTGNLRCN